MPVRSRSIALVFIPALAALASGGCASYAPPQLTVTRGYISQETPEGFVITFDVDALNTNSIELPLRELRYTLHLDGQPVFYGVRSPEATLRRLGTQQISFPAAIRLDPDAPRPAGPARYTVSGRLSYTTPGELAQALFDLRVRRPSVRFTQSGTLDPAVEQ